jgi:hypothetical protein
VHCLCPSTITSVPSHRDWSENLLACVQCIEDASGTNSDLSNSLMEQKRALCRGDSGISIFVHAVKELGSRAGFPLSLPDVQLKAHLDLRSISDDSCPPEHRCDHDDCLRQCIQESAAVNSFCATYTQSVGTCTTSLPAFVSHCGNSPARISSACSCLPSVTTQPTGTLTGTGAPSKSNPYSTPTSSSNGTATSPSSPSGAAPTTSVASPSSVASQPSASQSNSTTTLTSTSTETETATIIETQTRSVITVTSVENVTVTGYPPSSTSQSSVASQSSASPTTSAAPTTSSAASTSTHVSSSTHSSTSASSPSPSPSPWSTLPPNAAAQACASK